MHYTNPMQNGKPFVVPGFASAVAFNTQLMNARKLPPIEDKQEVYPKLQRCTQIAGDYRNKKYSANPLLNSTSVKRIVHSPMTST
jgi:hypothetical protein